MSADKRREPRISVGLSIRIAYGSVSEFVERHALNISQGGIFVRTRDTAPQGTAVQLDIRLQGGAKVIQGKGVVAWTMAPSAPGEAHREPGMGIQFTELDPPSQVVVAEIVQLIEAGQVRPQPAGPDAAPAAPESSIEIGPTPAPAPGAAAPPARRRPSRTVGIDLGTTNSCVGVAEGGKVRVLQSREGYRTIPSVVAFDPEGRLLVGHAAKGQMIVNPHDTVYGAKRLVGRPFASPTVQACSDRFHYDIVEGPLGSTAVRFAGRDFSLQQIQAFVLSEIRAMATQALGEPVERAVVTVPAYYNDHQRNAVREAGRLAGLHIERIVNEPTAAALAFGFGKDLQQRILIYDLGGGTFDASVLEIEGDVYEVVSTGGDTFLGGADFDAQVMDHLVWHYTERHGVPPPEDRRVWQRIRDAAEEAKVALSERERTTIRVPHLGHAPDGSDLGLDVELTREELEGLTGHLVERTIEVCREVLAARGIVTGDVDQVILVGGQSRMPLVARRIREVFGREPSKGVHPDEAVALGAALLAESDARIDSVVLIDVLAIGIGVGLPGGRMAAVLPRNTRLPARKSYEIATVKDDQEELELTVFQGDSPKVSECEYLGTVKLAGLPPAPRGSVRFSVEFALGAEGILSVTARNLGTGEQTRVQLATLDTPDSLREKLQLPEAQTAPKGARPYQPVREAPRPTPLPGAVAGEQEATATEKPGDARRPGLLGRLFGRRG